MKVTIITVCFNSARTIEDTIRSVSEQNYNNIEYIVVDGGSSDETNAIVKRYASKVSKHIIEKDDGLYDAMNKGIAASTGDLVGILNSDDVFINDDVIGSIVENIGSFDGIYGDVGFYDEGLLNKKRHYSSAKFIKEKFSRGFMPAHPSFYITRRMLDKVGDYNISYKIAADFDFLLRAFYIPNSKYKYLEKEIVKMRLGGLSTSGLKANYLLNKEIIESCQCNGITCSWFGILSKYPEKFLGYILK